MSQSKKQGTSDAAGSAPAQPKGPNAAADAFALVEPEIAALPAEELAPQPADFSAAINVALAAVPRIQEHHAAIGEQLPKHPIAVVEKIETYAQAAYYAHLTHAYASNGPEALKALVDEANKLRDGMLIAAEALAHRNLLDADAVAVIRKGSDDADTAGGLTALAALFKENWGKVASKTAVERHEVERAAELGPAMLVAMHAKKQTGQALDTEAQRARAFTLLTHAYDAARHALAYVRWQEGDAESIAPSLMKKKPGRKSGGAKDGAADGATPDAP